ncbi:MAG: 7TM-DISM domain-containing protein, partial [Bdellovibrionota bacterium]|nr:7TM-DISM domain-containing protein [Bdellovibrionota bacterium]
MKLIFFIFIFTFFNTYSFSKDNVLVLKNGIVEYQIGPFVEVLEDKTNKLTIKDIENEQYKKEFKRNKLDTIELKTGTSTYWLKIKTENKRLKES